MNIVVIIFSINVPSFKIYLLISTYTFIAQLLFNKDLYNSTAVQSNRNLTIFLEYWYYLVELEISISQPNLKKKK